MRLEHLSKGIVWSYRGPRLTLWLWRPFVWRFWRWPHVEYRGGGEYYWQFGPLDGSVRGLARKEWDKHGRRKPGY